MLHTYHGSALMPIKPFQHLIYRVLRFSTTVAVFSLKKEYLVFDTLPVHVCVGMFSYFCFRFTLSIVFASFLLFLFFCLFAFFFFPDVHGRGTWREDVQGQHVPQGHSQVHVAGENFVLREPRPSFEKRMNWLWRRKGRVPRTCRWSIYK